MRAQETVLRPQAQSSNEHGISSAFPPEVLEQVRGRVRLLALLILVAFAFDLVVYVGNWAAMFLGYPPASSFFETSAFQVINLAAVVASAGLWWVARSRHVSASRLHTLGLGYEIVICFIIAMITFWQYYIVHRMLPNLTWVPALVFDAESPMALLLHHTSTPPTPPSARTELAIPTALDQLVLSCLAKDPAARPQSARELSRRLTEVEGASTWTEDRARHWWATHHPPSLSRWRSLTILPEKVEEKPDILDTDAFSRRS